MNSSPGQCALVTIPISHYCEKARWALERSGVPYVERAHMQLIHRIAVRRAGGGTTAPVLVCGQEVLADSPEILAWADRRMPAEHRIYPDDPGARAEVEALERNFDTRLGPHGRLWMYNGIRGRRDLVLAYGTTGVPAWERGAVPLLYPLMSRGIDRVLGVTPAASARSEWVVRSTFDEVARLLQDGRPYLAGDRFSAADLTFAALSASVLMPPGYGVPLPQPEELPAALAATVRELRRHPAGAHALAVYRDERRNS